MALELRVTRTQIWVARGAIAILIIMIILAKTVGPGGVSSVQDGGETIYSESLFGTVLIGVLSLLACVVAVFYWVQSDRLFKLVGVGLFGIGMVGFVSVPNGLSRQVVVSPEGFERRVGSWYAPDEQQVFFADVLHFELVELQPGDKGRKRFELQYLTKHDVEIRALPVYDLMQAALPEVYRKAAEHGIAILETGDGLQ